MITTRGRYRSSVKPASTSSSQPSTSIETMSMSVHIRRLQGEDRIKPAHADGDVPKIELGRMQRSILVLYGQRGARFERERDTLVDSAVGIDNLEVDGVFVRIGTGVLEHLMPGGRCASQKTGLGSIAMTRHPRSRYIALIERKSGPAAPTSTNTPRERLPKNASWTVRSSSCSACDLVAIRPVGRSSRLPKAISRESLARRFEIEAAPRLRSAGSERRRGRLRSGG